LLPGRRGRGVAALLAAATLGAGLWAQQTGGAEIPFARGRYQSQLLAVSWNPMSRVAAYPLAPGDLQRPPGLSRAYRGTRPRQVGLVVDDSGYTNLFDAGQARANPEYFRANLVALAYHLRPAARALILGPGGGKDVWIALSFPGTRVRAVEINPQVVAMVQDLFPEFTGRLYADPRVELTVADARRFAATDSGAYDVVEASAVFGRLPPAAGAFTLSEDLLHTAEAFQDYWQRLGGDGILSVTRFAYDRRALRLTALARELLERQGVSEPGRNVRVLSSGGLANLLVGRAPFSAAEDATLAALAGRYGFRFLYPAMDGPTALTRLLDEVDVQPALDALPYDVSAPTDDRPFFYYTVRPREFLAGRSPDRPGFDNRGAELLRAAFLVLVGLTVAALLLPLPLLRGLPRIAGWGTRVVAPIAYGVLVGLGYMALEIGTMKRLTLFLGHPVYAAAATLFAFLLGSGAGSLWSARLTGSRRGLAGVLAAAAGFGVIHALFTPALLRPFAGSGFLLRWSLASALVLPLAFALGAAFPTAMARLRGAARDVLPWAWAANGAASVLGSMAAVLIAMNSGYTATLLTGAGLYAAALLTTLAFPRAGTT
jgi:SAM-dependent methyltransferase